MSKLPFFSLQDAIHLMAPKSFVALTKPVGALCNLDCVYCYYLDKQRLYGNSPKVMADDLLERYIRAYIQTNEVPTLSFVWHGGEPLLAGLAFFEKVVRLQQKHNPKRKVIENLIQTNGTLLNEAWCRFFKEHRFLVGISIDGPKEIHDTYRKNRSGEGSFDRTMCGLEMLKHHKVDFNSLTVVSAHAQGRGKEIYTFLKDNGVKFMQFLPSVDYIKPFEGSLRPVTVSSFEGSLRPVDVPPIGGSLRPVMVSPLKAAEAELAPWSLEAELAPWSVSGTGYGTFLIDVFNEWVVGDVGSIFVQLFDNTLCVWHGIEPSLCSCCETCGNSIAVEHNGDVYSCDHFVYPEHLLGNIQSRSLKEMLESLQQIDFGLNKRNTLSNECLHCDYYFACRGACPAHRHLKTAENQYKSSLCDGLKTFYTHTAPFMKYMSDLIRARKTASEVIPYARKVLL